MEQKKQRIFLAGVILIAVISLLAGGYFTLRKGVSLDAKGDSVTISFPDGPSWTGFWDGENFTDSEGFLIGWWAEIRLYTEDGQPEPGDADYCQPLNKVYFGQEETISAWYILGAGVLVYILGVVTVLYPDKVHFLFSKWAYNNPELSDAGILAERIGGVVVLILGICLMTGIVWML